MKFQFFTLLLSLLLAYLYQQYADKFRQDKPQSASSSIIDERKLIIGDFCPDKSITYHLGSVWHNWKVIKVALLQELNVTSITLEHQPTKAQFFHIFAAQQQNNLFSIALRTPPNDSTGLTHILEHLVLCGSKRYPVKDPFFSMITRSMNTYMNAWTASDHTIYLFSSQIEKDFYHLAAVYLDAVFFPLLRERDFKQEAYRVERNNVTNEQQVKGVVYHEMQGVLNDPNYYFMIQMQQHLYQESIYGYNSGGNPIDILSLEYTTLKQFHAKYYHPSNALFYSMGNFCLAKQLEYVDQVLQPFANDKLQVGKDLLAQSNHTAKVNTTFNELHTVFGPVDASASLNHAVKYAMGFITNEAHDTYASFVLSVLSTLLFKQPRGPMYKSIIESGLAPEFLSINGYEHEELIRNRTSFVIGVTGIALEDVDKVKSTIIDTLRNITLSCPDEPTFTTLDINRILFQLELARKKFTPEQGMQLLTSVVPMWVHGQDPNIALRMDGNIQRLRTQFELDPCYLEKQIYTYLLNATQVTHLIMLPNENFTTDWKIKEKDWLLMYDEKPAEQRDEHTAKQDTAMDDTKNEAMDADKILPKLKLNDIPKLIKPVSTRVKVDLVEGVPLHVYKQPTNGIAYLTLYSYVNKDQIPYDLLHYVDLFLDMLTELGAGAYSHTELADAIELYTSGISASVMVVPSFKDVDIGTFGFTMSSTCLLKNMQYMTDLMYVIYTMPHWNNTEYMKTLFHQHVATITDSLTYKGNRYAELLAASYLSPTDNINEQIAGVSYIQFIKDLANRNDSIELLSNAFKRLTQVLLKNTDFKLLLTVDDTEAAEDYIDKLVRKILDKTPASRANTAPSSNQFAVKPKSFVPVQTTVNFVAKSSTIVPYLQKDMHHAHLKIMANTLFHFLHGEIREKGGAYGSRAAVSLTGLLVMSSYRDPHVNRTLQVFEEAKQWICSDRITENDIQQGILHAMQEEDRPVTPHDEAMEYFITNVSDDQRQEYRSALMKTSQEQISTACKLYLDGGKQNSAVIGNQDNHMPEWNVIKIRE